MVVKLISKLFGKKDSARVEEPQTSIPTLGWIEASKNSWNVELLDLRPITQNMVSTSKDAQMAANAVSYGSEDGTAFIGQEPEFSGEIASNFSLVVDPVLAPGVLFAPDSMEQKWAIFFHQNTLLFVRSWLRKVMVAAETRQQDGRLVVTKLSGRFSEDDEPDFTLAVMKYLLITHAIKEAFPAPLPINFSTDTQSAGLWAMSTYGKMAHVGIFSTALEETTATPIRSISLLHIAVARGDVSKVRVYINEGMPIDLLASDGLSPLHWSIAVEGVNVMKCLIELGAGVNVQSAEGATPLMNAVQSNKMEKII